MSRSVRLSIVVLGLALAVYGTSTLTGGWLGTPPWWEHQEYELVRPQGGSRSVWKPTEGRELISLGVALAGVGVVALSRSRIALRSSIVAIGLACVLYGVASLTGNWLSTPPWWLQFQFRFIPMESTGPFSGRSLPASDEDYFAEGPRKHREAWSGVVVGVGVGLVAFGAWPRRRRVASQP